MKSFTLVPAMALALLASGTTFAGTLQSSINVSAVVTEACSSLTAGDINFGSLGALNVDDDQTTTISVTCDPGANFSVDIDYGQNALNVTQRQVAGAVTAEFMDYDIFKPTAAGTASITSGMWGQGVDKYDSQGTGSAQSLIATGRLHRNQGTTAGTYSDLVTVTLTY